MSASDLFAAELLHLLQVYCSVTPTSPSSSPPLPACARATSKGPPRDSNSYRIMLDHRHTRVDHVVLQVGCATLQAEWPSLAEGQTPTLLVMMGPDAAEVWGPFWEHAC